MSWCPSWSNSLWQGWSCQLVYCPGGNATDPILRVLASSLGISSWTPLKPQHSNPNPLANQLWCIDFFTPPTPLIIPHRLPAFLDKENDEIRIQWLHKSSSSVNIKLLMYYIKFYQDCSSINVILYVYLPLIKNEKFWFGNLCHYLVTFKYFLLI